MRFENYKKQPLRYAIPASFNGTLASRGIAYRHDGGKQHPRAAIIREKGVNGDREMAYSLYLAGFDVKDVHMTDLMSGREKLDDISMIVFCGGFSNSDVLGSAKGADSVGTRPPKKPSDVSTTAPTPSASASATVAS
jgi:phosphoribosylformylglycinamidine synthase